MRAPSLEKRIAELERVVAVLELQTSMAGTVLRLRADPLPAFRQLSADEQEKLDFAAEMAYCERWGPVMRFVPNRLRPELFRRPKAAR